MAYSNKMMEEFSVASLLALNNSQKIPEVKDIIPQLGYTAEVVVQGIGMHKVFNDFVQDHVTKRKEKRKATIRANRAFKKAYEPYMDLVDLFRKAFADDPESMQMLGLHGERQRTTAKFISQATNFYNTAMTETGIFTIINTKFQITQEKLQENLDLVKTYATRIEEQADAKGALQRTTEQRNESFREFRKWMREFEKACRILLKDKPQLVERLGFFEPSEGYKPKKKEDETPETPEAPGGTEG